MPIRAHSRNPWFDTHCAEIAEVGVNYNAVFYWGRKIAFLTEKPKK
jgi:hypothetical protein